MVYSIYTHHPIQIYDEKTKESSKSVIIFKIITNILIKAVVNNLDQIVGYLDDFRIVLGAHFYQV